MASAHPAAHFGLAALALGAVLTSARLVQADFGLAIVFVGFTPLGLPLDALALLLLVVGLVRGPVRRWVPVATAIALLGFVLHAFWLLPMYVGSHPDAGRTPDLTVVELNMAHGGAEPATVLSAVRRDHADLLVLAEITPAARDALRSAGLDDLLPYSVGATGSGRTGLMVFARQPLGTASPVAGATHAFRVTMTGPVPLTLVAAHVAQPLTRPATWDSDGRALAAAVWSLDGPVLVVGDLNATDDHVLLHRLFDAGLHDAAEEANSGWQPTWPAVLDIPVLRWAGLGALDHVLFSRPIGVVSTSTVVAPGTDHRMLVARLVGPRADAQSATTPSPAP